MRALPCWILPLTDGVIDRPLCSSFARCPSSQTTILMCIPSFSTSSARPSVNVLPSEAAGSDGSALSVLACVTRPLADPARSGFSESVWRVGCSEACWRCVSVESTPQTVRVHHRFVYKGRDGHQPFT